MFARRSPWTLALISVLPSLGAAGCEVVAGIHDIQLATNSGADDAGDGGGGAQVDAGGAPDGAVCHRGVAAMSVACDCSERIDADHDGYFTCDADPKSVDCDDYDAKVHPGAAEVCNGKDDDCNGIVDDVPAQLHGSLSAPADPHWVAAGSAALATASGATLTSDVMGQTGAVWWQTAYTFDAFDMTATFAIEAKPDGADGCGFGWVPGVAVPGVGAGTGYGLGGLGGYGVAIDTYQNPTDPPVPFLAVLGADQRIATYAIPNVRDGHPHSMRVQLAAGALNVWIDTLQYVTHLAIPNYVPFTGYWGFAAGGGNAFEAHYLSDLTMSFPNGQGCRP